MRSLLLVTLLALGATLAAAQVPIPYRPDGFRLGGPPCSPVVFDVYLEFLCPDCQAAWPAIKDVVDYYQGNVSLSLHTFPLPYKTLGFTVAQAAHVVLAKDPSLTRSLFDFLFAKQGAFQNTAIADLTINQAKTKLIQMIAQAGFISEAELKAGLANSAFDWETRVSWKYACSRGVVGTPSFMINGVNVNGESEWTLAQWRQVIDPLLAPRVSKQESESFIEAAAPVKEACSKRSFATRMFVRHANDCPAGQEACQYLPGKFECCRGSEMCIPNVGCRC